MGTGLAPAEPDSQPGEELQLTQFSSLLSHRSPPARLYPLHFPLAQVIGLWVPIGCPLVLAAISHGTKMSMVTLETRQKGHKIQKPYCPSCSSPSKGIVQLWGPNLPQPAPHTHPTPSLARILILTSEAQPGENFKEVSKNPSL